MAPLFDANVFLRDDVSTDIGRIIDTLKAMKSELWTNELRCGTRPNPTNFKDPNVLINGSKNYHFRSLHSPLSLDRSRFDKAEHDLFCELLHRIVPDQELSENDCSVATMTKRGEFVVSNVAVRRMFQKQRTLLWEMYSIFESDKSNKMKLQSTLKSTPKVVAKLVERLWFVLFRGYVPAPRRRGTGYSNDTIGQSAD